MRKIIRSNLMKMAGIVLAIFALAGWAHHFVWSGIISNIYLNGAIIGLLVFAVYLCFRNVFKLKNEIIAFEALQEVWDDIRNDEQRSAEDPYWRHYRTLDVGHVFSRPPLLGHIYDLTYEELLRSRKLRISLETMQSLMHGIDSRLSGERSLINYLGGLLVFLGLIGTFIGLMEMVASVGGIIGALNNAGGGGDAMKQLLTDLQAPLTGMATGFSSSLFGLFGSLTVGLVSRFGNRAADSLRDAFESWLAGVSQLENEDGVRPASGSGGSGGAIVYADGASLIGGDPERGKLAARALESIARNMKLNTETLDRVAKLMERMATAQAEQRDYMDRTAAGLERLAMQQADLPVQLGKIAANEGLRGDIVDLSTVVYDRMRDGFADVAASLVAVLEANSEQFQKLAGQQAEIMESMAVVAKISPLTDELRRIGMSLEKGVADGFTDVAKVFDLSSKTQTEAMRYLADHQTQMTGYMSRVVDGATSVSDMRKLGEGIEQGVGQGLARVAQAMEKAAREQSEALARLAAHGPGGDTDVLRLEMRALGRSIETGMQDGFGELARAFEAAFVSYAELLQRSLADMPRAAVRQPEPATEPDPVPTPMTPDAFADHEAMMLKLYSTAASQLTTKQA
jgi:hypothetical protein